MQLSTVRWITPVIVALVMLPLLAACSDDDGEGTATARPSGFSFDPSASGRPADSSFVFTIEEVGLGPDGYVKLRNFSTNPASPEGLFLCQPPACVALTDTEVAAGETVVVAASDNTGQEAILLSWPDLALNPSDGELGIYASEDTADPAQVRAYMQWGSEPHAGTEAAVEAGFWVAGYAPTSENATRLFQNENGLWLFDE